MILVTGANGQYGNATINHLLDQDARAEEIIAMVRNTESAKELKEKGVQIRKGDYNDYSSLVSAFSGVKHLLFISSSDIQNRNKQHENVLKAAKESGVEHIIYTSFLSKNETESSPLWLVSQSHLQTENWLKDSGINYTILKNNLYMDFVPAFVGDQVLETGLVFLPAGDGKVGAVLRSEMAEATARILGSSKLQGKVYNFTNSEAFSYQEVANTIAEISGKSIDYISPTAEEYARILGEYGVPSDLIGLFSSFAIAQAKDELDAVSSDLEFLLGRKPTSMSTFLSKVYSK
ncbi:SDR family oxidoreductase [Belliella aquatica]|uniref:NAD(P)-dependent oxidoreductase n=1 Tax=Belliella aquatica TaxID=1323734 RepID=A0ABQ1M119_9BACT|nr:SDR family oxidoreductase [Belliella aquatica]MCH7404889.1 SDR family oxidoreductase [Belliella aquatica]GGC33326.1 NAD(P)-dependent oxidoreductase [Belliella aquatica]